MMGWTESAGTGQNLIDLTVCPVLDQAATSPAGTMRVLNMQAWHASNMLRR